jgi:membrane protein insertase Oxa1/YidC/SpoIIIJ
MQLGVQRIVCLSMAPLLIGLHYPAGVFVYWITNNTISMAQVLAFNHPPVRAAFGLTPIPTAPTQGSAEEFENIRQKILSVSKSPALNVPEEGGKTRSG